MLHKSSEIDFETLQWAQPGRCGCKRVPSWAGSLNLATAADDGDAEVLLTREELAQFQRRLLEVIT